MKTFLVEMDERSGCSFVEYESYDLLFNGYCNRNGSFCMGNINDRPVWCPLREMRFVPAKTHDLDGKIWLEVERYRILSLVR